MAELTKEAALVIVNRLAEAALNTVRCNPEVGLNEMALCQEAISVVEDMIKGEQYLRGMLDRLKAVDALEVVEEIVQGSKCDHVWVRSAVDSPNYLRCATCGKQRP